MHYSAQKMALDTLKCWTWELGQNFSGAFRTVYNCSEYRMLEGILVENEGRKVGFILHSYQWQADGYSWNLFYYVVVF